MDVAAKKRQIPQEILNRRSYTSNSYTDFLLSQLRKDWIVEPEKDFAWKQDQQIYEKIRLDARYRAVEETLLAEIAAIEWSIVSKNDNKQVASLYEWFVDQIGGFAEARINLARAVIEGMAVLEIVGDFTTDIAPGDKKKRRWWVPKRLRFVSRERLRRSVHIDNKGKSWWIWRIFDPYLNVWIPLLDESRHIWSFYRATEENLGYGEGLAKSAYALIKLKVVLLELLAAGAERWVDSWILVKFDETMKETADLHDDGTIAQLVEDIAKMRSFGVLAHQNADIQLAPAGQSNTAQAILEMIEKIDREITILLTATNLSTDIRGGGSYAAARSQMEHQDKRLLFQRKSIVEEPLTDYLLSACRRWNKQNFQALGLQDHKTPYFQLSGGEFSNVPERLSVFQLAAQMGVPISEEDFRNQLKLSPPTGKVITPPQAQPMDLPSQSHSPLPPREGGFSLRNPINPTPTENPSFVFSEAAILEDLPEKDKKEGGEIEDAILQLGLSIAGQKLGKNSKEAVKQAEDEFIEVLQKTMLYFDLTGREEVIKAAEEAEEDEPE